MVHEVRTTLGGRELIIETGRLAKQASGSVLVRYGDSAVLAAVTAAKEPVEGQDFFPLTVAYVEKMFASGKIPGGFFKREGKPSEREVLTGRFIDRPIRPLFKDGYFNETQLVATVLSADPEHYPEQFAMIGASAALTVSPIPFLGPIAGVTVARVNGKLIINPSNREIEASDLHLEVAGSRDAVVMVEGSGHEVSETELVDAILYAHKELQPATDAQEKLAKMCGVVKWEVTPPQKDTELEGKINKLAADELKKALKITGKHERYDTISAIKTKVIDTLVPEEDEGEVEKKVADIFDELKGSVMREMVVKEKRRIDGRGFTDVRKITCETGLLPRAHGSALFTRGETQAIVVATLGTKGDQQIIEQIDGETTKRFMLHYNFPTFSTGEVKRMSPPSRREIGHGALAERALLNILPTEEEFAYTIRIVSEILESNGSSSMATVCGGTLSLMDAGVPIKKPVAGIAMGLIKEGSEAVILTDILGDEDHLGDMDFKVAGTKDGITAVQMDIKIAGITEDILRRALHQAKEGRLFILGKMLEALPEPRKEVSKFAPKLITIRIAKDKIGALIGPGGKNIRAIIEETGATIDIDDDGMVHIASVDGEAGEMALRRVEACTISPEAGKYYKGPVTKIMDFGAFIEVLPGIEGLCHISMIDNKRINKVTDVLREGDEVVVLVKEIDEASGKMRLSIKDAVGHEKDVEKL